MVKLHDDEVATANDFLRMIEYGSPLHNIIATQPIERVFHMLSNKIILAYEECIDDIMNKDVDEIVIQNKLRFVAQTIQLQLQTFVDPLIKSEIVCDLYYKRQKIN